MAKKCYKPITDPNSIPVDSVIWTGIDLDCFDVCNGDSITPLMEFLANSICNLLSTTDVTSTVLCDTLIQSLGNQNKTIGTLLQILSDETCSLRELLTQVQDQTNISNSLTLDFKCIATTDPCNDDQIKTLNQVLQLIINAFCELKNQFDIINDTIGDTINNSIEAYIDDLFVTALPNRIIKQTNPTKYQFRGFVPPNCPIPYFGSLTNFDSSGKGLGIYDGWYLANGKNGTVDMRGVVPIGAIQGMNGGTLPSYINPTANPITPSANYSVGDRGGKIGVAITEAQMPSHNHDLFTTVTQNPHSHNLTVKRSGNGGGGSPAAYNSNFGDDYLVSTTSTTIDLTINTQIDSTGGGQIHENRMPYLACAYIQMID